MSDKFWRYLYCLNVVYSRKLIKSGVASSLDNGCLISDCWAGATIQAVQSKQGLSWFVVLLRNLIFV